MFRKPFLRRWRSTLKQDDGFLVLPARATGILPKKRPEKKSRVSKSRFKFDGQNNLDFEVTFLDKPMVENQQVFMNMEGLKPLNPKVTKQRYEHIQESLAKGYKKQQLKDYLMSHNIPVTSSANKIKLAASILKNLWKLEETEGTLDITTNEYTVDLHERDFMLLISKNGQQVREWAKSGASIRINPTKCQFLIKCTPVTYDWIVASMHHLLDQSIREEEIDLTEIQNLMELTPQQLKIIQFLTNTYFEQTGSSLIIYSLDKIGILLAKRYLYQLTPCPANWITNTYYYDVSQNNLPEFHWAENTDYPALEWYKKGAAWFRWEQVKQKNSQPLDQSEYQPLESAEFNEQQVSQESIKAQIADRIKAKGTSNVTATLGFLLHRKNDEYVPNIAQKKIFNSNIPLVRRLGGQLGAYGMDTAQVLDEDFDSLDPFPAEAEAEDKTEASPLDAWSRLNLAIEKRTLVNRPSEITAPILEHTLRIKLIPSVIEHGADALKQHPPIELWCPLSTDNAGAIRKNNQISMENVLAFRLPHEHHDYISLPGKISDLRFTSSVVDQIDLSPEIRDFVTQCAVNKSGPLYIHNELMIDGIKYVYTESSFLGISEVNYNGRLLQLISIDGGNEGGRRIEANLVLNAASDDEPVDVAAFVDDAFELVNQVGKVRVEKGRI